MKVILLFSLLQDDALIESLLCLLDIYTGLHYGGVHSSRHGGMGLELETVTESSNILQEALDPLDGFDSFLQVIFNSFCCKVGLVLEIYRLKSIEK